MPTFLLYLVGMLIRAGIVALRTKRESTPEPLCASCTFAHTQYAVNGKRAIFCTFGGGVRPITIDVMYCTDYRDRCAPPRVAMLGFARALADGGPIAEAAITEAKAAPRI